MKLLPQFAMVLLATGAWAQSPAPAKDAPAKAVLKKSATPTLEQVLSQMDDAAEHFRNAEAKVVSQQYQQVVDETDTQSGKIYVRRQRDGLEVALDITQPATKFVLIKDGRAQLYEPNINQITEYSLAGSREKQEGMFALGFGGRGHDLLQSFRVELAGQEALDGVTVTKLILNPRSPKVKNMFARITLWIDPARDVSLMQQFDEPGGDWRKAHYTEIKLNQRLGDDVFKLHTRGHPNVVRPQG